MHQFLNLIGTHWHTRNDARFQRQTHQRSRSLLISNMTLNSPHVAAEGFRPTKLNDLRENYGRRRAGENKR
jgi:hypothetical protein